MFFWFGFPLFFFIPFLLLFLLLRAGSSMLKSRHQGFLGYGPQSFFSGFRVDIEARVFQLAYKLKGRVTVSDIVIETGLSVREAEAAIHGMVDNSRVRMEVGDNGLVTYEFPEIIARFEN